MRTFVAVTLPEPVRSQITLLIERLRTDLRAAQLDHHVRWVPTANLHLTLRFLGETTPVQAKAVAAGIVEAVRHHPPLDLDVYKLGCFPNARSPRVLWLGLQGDLDSLGRLQSAVEAAVQRAGYDPDPRAFSPHLTIGRVRRGVPRSALQALGAGLSAASAAMDVARVWEKDQLSFQVRELVLMRSELKPAGSVYTSVEHFRFP